MRTELSYVRENLQKVGPSGWPSLVKKTGVSIRTLRRIACSELGSHRSDNIGKLALHFQTQEKRRR